MGRAGVGAGGRRAPGRDELLCPMGAMTSRAVTSLTNPTVKAIRALHLRKARDETGLFVAEGLKTVTEGVELGRPPRILLRGGDDHPLLRKAIAATEAAGGEAIQGTPDILAKV